MSTQSGYRVIDSEIVKYQSNNGNYSSYESNTTYPETPVQVSNVTQAIQKLEQVSVPEVVQVVSNFFTYSFKWHSQQSRTTALECLAAMLLTTQHGLVRQFELHKTKLLETVKKDMADQVAALAQRWGFQKFYYEHNKPITPELCYFSSPPETVTTEYYEEITSSGNADYDEFRKEYYSTRDYGPPSYTKKYADPYVDGFICERYNASYLRYMRERMTDPPTKRVLKRRSTVYRWDYKRIEGYADPIPIQALQVLNKLDGLGFVPDGFWVADKIEVQAGRNVDPILCCSFAHWFIGLAKWE